MSLYVDPYGGHSIFGQKYDGPGLANYGPFINLSGNDKTTKYDKNGKARYDDTGMPFCNDHQHTVTAVTYVGEGGILQEAMTEDVVKRHPEYGQKLDMFRQNNGAGTYHGKFYCLVYDRMKHRYVKGLYDIPNKTFIKISKGNKLEYGIILGSFCSVDKNTVAWTWEWRDGYTWTVGVINYAKLPGAIEYSKEIQLKWNDFHEIKRINEFDDKTKHYIFSVCEEFVNESKEKELCDLRKNNNRVTDKLEARIINTIYNKLFGGKKLDTIGIKNGTIVGVDRIVIKPILERMKISGFTISRKTKNSVILNFGNIGVLTFGAHFGLENICRIYKNHFYVLKMNDMRYSIAQEKLYWKGQASEVPFSDPIVEELKKFGEIPGLAESNNT